jgi:hypothetical protein
MFLRRVMGQNLDRDAAEKCDAAAVPPEGVKTTVGP